MYLTLPEEAEYKLPNTAIVYLTDRDSGFIVLPEIPRHWTGWYWYFCDHEGLFVPRTPVGPYETAGDAIQAAIRYARWNVRAQGKGESFGQSVEQEQQQCLQQAKMRRRHARSRP